MKTHQLDDRSRNILLQTISDYISTAEPIGSRALSKNLREKLSPATIRNVMADLEDMGYLQQPHPSAGRIPTDWGYRFFVDQILQLNSRSAPQIYIGREDYSLADMDQTLEGVLEKTCNLLSENSKQTSLVMPPVFSNMLLKQVNFIKVGKNEALAVFITEMGALENKVIRVETDYTQALIDNPGLDENNFRLFFFDTTLNSWGKIPIASQNTTLDQLKFKIDHLTEFAVVDLGSANSAIFLPIILK